MAIRSIKTVRTSDNTRFKLFTDVMRGDNYFMYRSDFRLALQSSRDAAIRYFSTYTSLGTLMHFAYIKHGPSQRRKKFISIGCMKFVGDNRTAILKWAK